MSIVLVPIGKIETHILELVRSGTSQALDRPVEMGSGIPEPQHLFDPRREQYGSAVLIPLLHAEQKKRHYQRVLGIINTDLFFHQAYFVFGHTMETTGLFSLSRLRPEFERRAPNQRLFERRVLTEGIHQLGHTYRLHHCTDPRCVMFPSHTVDSIDKKGPYFCPQCKATLE